MLGNESTRAALQGGRIGRLAETVCQACLIVAALALLGIVAVNGANVIGRYAFGSPFSWAEELMLFLMVLVVFAGAPAIAWRNMHIRIDAIVERTEPRLRRALTIATAVISVVILAIVATAGLGIVFALYQFDQRSDALHLPVWIPQAFLTGGLALTAVMMIAVLKLPRQR